MSELRELQFQATRLDELESRRLKKQHRAVGSRAAFLSTVLVVAAVYSIKPLSFYVFNRPGDIELTSTVSDGTFSLRGKVEDARLDTITLEVDGSPTTVPIRNGEFSVPLPLAQRAITTKASAGGSTSIITILPPQILIATPKSGSFIHDKRVTLSGSVKNFQTNALTISVNGSESIVPVDHDAFISTVLLASDTNVIQAKVGKISSDPIIIMQQSLQAQIKINSPLAGLATQDETIEVKGEIGEDTVKTVTLKVNGVSRELPVNNGRFVTRVQLNLGNNTIEAIAKNAQPKTIRISRSEPPPGIIKIASPDKGPLAIGSTIVVKGTVQNKQVTKTKLTVNGTSQEVSVKDGVFVAPKVRLTRPQNTIVASASGVESNAIRVIAQSDPNARGKIVDNGEPQLPPKPVTTKLKNCDGTITTSRTIGYAGDPIDVIIIIKPDPDMVIKHVLTDNPGCRKDNPSCEAKQDAKSPGRFVIHLTLDTSASVKFFAIDEKGRTRCDESSARVTVLPRK